MKPTIEELRRIARRSTFHRRKAEAMGWRFQDIDVQKSFARGDIVLKCDFICVCGAAERFTQVVDSMFIEHANDVLIHFDPARQLFSAGSFSREHLIKDGFDPEFVERVVKIGQEYRE